MPRPDGPAAPIPARILDRPGSPAGLDAVGVIASMHKPRCGRSFELALGELGRQLRVIGALSRFAEQVDVENVAAPGSLVAALAYLLDEQRADRAFAFAAGRDMQSRPASI